MEAVMFMSKYHIRIYVEDLRKHMGNRSTDCSL
jgi:hypothetical protein